MKITKKELLKLNESLKKWIRLTEGKKIKNNKGDFDVNLALNGFNSSYDNLIERAKKIREELATFKKDAEELYLLGNDEKFYKSTKKGLSPINKTFRKRVSFLEILRRIQDPWYKETIK